MAKQLLALGNAPNDNTGDTLRNGGDKINDNFDEIYAAIGNGSAIQINIANANTYQVLRYNGTSFVPADFNLLTTNLNVNSNSIVSSSNGNISITPNGTGDVIITNGSTTNTFDGASGEIDLPTKVKYKNEYSALGAAPTASNYPGYFFTVDGDDNPYVNINITTGGIGDVRAKLLTEYSGINSLKDVDTTTTTPTNNQVLKWNSATSKWRPANDDSGLSSVNTFVTVSGDTGSTTADSQTDILTIAGGNNIVTSVSGDTLTVSFNGTLTTTFAALTDTNVTGLTQGDSLYWNGTNWVVTRSPMTWWELGQNGTSDWTFAGPGFSGSNADPTIYVHRGFSYAFDNSIGGGNHPFRIQSTQGLTGTPYTTGQSGSGTSVLYWTVPMDAPTTLYYQCTNHALMNGTINVVS